MPIIQSRSKSKQQRRTVTRVHTAPFRRARAAGRRRSLRGDAGQAALVLVIAITVLLTTVGGVMIANIVNNDPLFTQASIQRYAYRAMESGLNAEYYKFDNPQTVIDSTTSIVTSLQVQIVGAAGFSGKNVDYSTVAKFV